MSFDPQKDYSWKMEDRFEMSGKEFGLMLNAFRAILSTEKAQEILLVNEANKQADAILRRGYELGIVKEGSTPADAIPPVPFNPPKKTKELPVTDAEIVE